MLQDPYSSVVPPFRPAGALPQHPLKSPDEDLVLIPLKFTIAAGALVSQQCTDRCLVVDLGDETLRLYHPACRPGSVSLFLSVPDGDGYAISHTTAASGYSTITVEEGADGTYQGYLALRYQRVTVGNVVNGSLPAANPLKSLQAGGLRPVYGGVPDLSLFWIRVDISAGNAYVANSAQGWGPFNIVRTGAGAFTIALGAQLNPSWVFMTLSSSQHGTATLAANNKDLLVTLAADPGASTLYILAMGPTSGAGVKACTTVPAAPPKDSKKMYPAWAMIRDTVFVAYRLNIDGAGAVVVGPTSTLPSNGFRVAKSGNDIQLSTGFAMPALGHAFLKRDSNQARFAVVKTAVQASGIWAFAMGANQATSYLTGAVVASAGSRR
jgi:hypothetical protein